MPNKPRPENPARPVRVNDTLWTAVRERAKADGVTPSEVVRTALRTYLEKP